MLRLLEDKSPKQGCACWHRTAPKDGAGRPPSQELDCKVHHCQTITSKKYRKGFEVQLNVKNETEKPDDKQRS